MFNMYVDPAYLLAPPTAPCHGTAMLYLCARNGHLPHHQGNAMRYLYIGLGHLPHCHGTAMLYLYVTCKPHPLVTLPWYYHAVFVCRSHPKKPLFYLTMPVEHIDFQIISYWSPSIWSL